MRQYFFHVYFRDGQRSEIWAFCSEDAEILAQAQRIKDGKDRTVTSVIKTKDKP